jgi:hypothetical protein
VVNELKSHIRANGSDDLCAHTLRDLFARWTEHYRHQREPVHGAGLLKAEAKAPKVAPLSCEHILPLNYQQAQLTID